MALFQLDLTALVYLPFMSAYLSWLPIMLAMLDGQPKCAHALLKAGAKLTLTDPRSFAQMMMSVWQSKPGIGDMLAYQRCMLLLSV